MRALKACIPLLLCLLPQTVSAQFFTGGDDPASARWNYIESPNFKVIYPSGIDSTARSYILELEKYRLPVSRSVGFAPGEKSFGKIPVILHPFSAVANGSVAWAPKRMDLYSVPSGYDQEPMPWTTMLAIHESRHVAQMQFGLSHCFRPFRYIFGEMFAGALAGVYPDKWLLEGDAVVAETALSLSGRGRTGDFMNYYRIAFDDGDFRDADRWAYGSYWHYTPDYYAFGYMTIAGIRYLYDVPDFSGQLFTHYARRPLDITARNTVSRRLTGKKFRSLVNESMHLWHELWTEDVAERGPFLPYELILDEPRVHTEYSDNLVIGDCLYSLKESLNSGRKLVKIDDEGKETVISSFGSDVGMLFCSEGQDRMYWSETLPHARWSLKSSSAIRYMDMETGRKKTLLGGSRLFNPHPSPDGTLIAAAEFTEDGKSRLTVICAESGRREVSFSLPDSLQITECAWLGNTLYASAISAHGYGIYHLKTDGFRRNDDSLYVSGFRRNTAVSGPEEWEVTLAPTPVVISNLGTEDDFLMFTSDRTGVNEMYLMNPGTGQVWQETSFRYGSSDYTFSEDGEYLICSIRDKSGAPTVKVKTEDLLHRAVDFNARYEWKVADALSRQEKELAGISVAGKEGQAYRAEDRNPSETAVDALSISRPKRFRKFPNLFNLHSWAPFYFDYNNISSGSYEDYYSALSIGASAFFQNRLGTFTGFAGYSAHPDIYTGGPWRHSGHARLTYSGLYPVFEARFDINDRASRTLYGTEYTDIVNGLLGKDYAYRYGGSPLISGSLSVYIPFNFSSGGWSRGFIPQISYEISNDRFDRTLQNVYVMQNPVTGTAELRPGADKTPDTKIYQSFNAAARFYTMRPAAHADVYPELGFGIEAGISVHPGLEDMVAPNAYVYAYGYVPGICRNQGLMLTTLFSRRFGGQTPIVSGVNTLPRGFTSVSEAGNWAASQEYGIKLTGSYAIPFPLGDFHIGNLFYVTRGILTPHFDWSFIGDAQLFSAGATLEIEFGNFIGLQFPAALGITWSYNGGPSYSAFRSLEVSRHYVGPVFSMDF